MEKLKEEISEQGGRPRFISQTKHFSNLAIKYMDE